MAFGPGLNLIYGPSNTGKSSIYDAIDFMFGRERKLKEIPEHEGYESILLGLIFSDSHSCTLVRSLSGGDIKSYEGLHEKIPDGIEFTVLKPKKATKKLGDLPNYILNRIGFENKWLKKNQKNETNKLTLRTFLPLIFVNETKIQRESSPYVATQYTQITADKSRLKLLLTGVDDSDLVPEEKEKKVLSRNTRVQLLMELIEDQESRTEGLTASPDELVELEDQNTRLEEALRVRMIELQSTEVEYGVHVERRNKLRKKLDDHENRFSEISEIEKKFELLNDQYETDRLRLESIIETGTLLGGLSLMKNCPVCGVDTDDTHAHDFCETNTEATVAAASGEHQKVLTLSYELNGVIGKLREETIHLGLSLPGVSQELLQSEEKVQSLSPSLTDQRSQYSELLLKRSEVKRNISLIEDLQRLIKKYNEVMGEAPETNPSETAEIHLPKYALSKLSERVANFLSTWGIVTSPHVYFDKEVNDFVINGKARTSNGKGIRAIMHAAATLSLLGYTEDEKLPHAGLVLLDTPLLAYEKPEGEDDDLSGTDVNLKFFRNLQEWGTRQTIVFENKKSIPEKFQEGAQITHFTKSTISGRYGFFPSVNLKARE